MYNIERSQGASQIRQFCHDAAKKHGLDFERVYWSFEVSKPPQPDCHILMIETNTNDTEVAHFTRAEIEAYPSGRETEQANKKIISAIERL